MGIRNVLTSFIAGLVVLALVTPGVAWSDGDRQYKNRPGYSGQHRDHRGGKHSRHHDSKDRHHKRHHRGHSDDDYYGDDNYDDDSDGEDLLIGLLIGGLFGYVIASSQYDADYEADHNPSVSAPPPRANYPGTRYYDEDYRPPATSQPLPDYYPRARYEEKSYNATCLQEKEYQTTVIISGSPQQVFGSACLQADGSWKRGPAIVKAY